MISEPRAPHLSGFEAVYETAVAHTALFMPFRLKQQEQQ